MCPLEFLINSKRLNSSINAVDINDAVKRMRDQIHQLSEVRQQAVQIAKPFEEVDRTGEGNVTFLQFTACLRKLGLVVPMEDIQAVAAKCTAREKVPVGQGSRSFVPLNRDKVDYRKFESLMSL